MQEKPLRPRNYCEEEPTEVQPTERCPLCREWQAKFESLQREHRHALRTISRLGRDLREERAAHQTEYVRLQSQLELARQEVLVGRTRMREMLQQHYRDFIKQGIQNGDIIVTEPKEGDK